MSIRAIFFDAGDTLLHKWVLKQERFLWLCRQAGIELPADPDRIAAGVAAHERFFQNRRKHVVNVDWFVRLNRTGLAAMGITGDLDALARRIHEAGDQVPDQRFVDPEALPLLEYLRSRGIRLAVVSNWDGSLVNAMRSTGLSGYFDAMLDSDVVGSRKPDTGIFRLACACTGVRAEEAVHVGDSPAADVAGAQAAGVRPVLLDALDLFGEGFEGLPPFDRVTRLADLPALLGL